MAEINPKDFAKVHYIAPPGPTGVVQVLIYLEQDGPDHLMIHHCLVMPELGTVDVKLTMETEPALAHYKAFDQQAAVTFWTKTTQEITQMFGDGTEDSDEGYAGDTATLVSVDEADSIQVVFNEDTGVMSLATENILDGAPQGKPSPVLSTAGDVAQVCLDNGFPCINVAWENHDPKLGRQTGAMCIPEMFVEVLTEDGIISGDDRDSMVLADGLTLDDLEVAVIAYARTEILQAHLSQAMMDEGVDG